MLIEPMKLIDYINAEIEQQKLFASAISPKNVIALANTAGYIQALDLLQQNIDNGMIDVEV